MSKPLDAIHYLTYIQHTNRHQTEINVYFLGFAFLALWIPAAPVVDMVAPGIAGALWLTSAPFLAAFSFIRAEETDRNCL